MTNQQIPDDNMQNRIKNLFAGQEPVSHASIREVEAMQARIKELEAELAGRPKDDSPVATNFSETKLDSLPKSRDQKEQAQENKKSRLPRLFSAPVFEDDLEKTRSAKQLHQIATASWLLPIVGVLVSFLNPAVGRFALPSSTVLAIVLTAIMFLNRAGRVRLASNIIVGTLLVVLTYLNYGNAGEPRPLLILSVVAIMVSGLLLGGRSPIVISILLLAQHVVIVYLHAKGLIVPQSGLPGPAQNIIVVGVSYVLIGFMLRLAVSRIQVVLNELRQDEAELEIRNRELQAFSGSMERRVADRTHDLELASAVGRAISEKVGNLTELLAGAAETIRSSFGLYYAQVYLLDAAGRNLVLRAGTGEAGVQLLQSGHRLSILSPSLNARAASSQKPVLVDDTQTSVDFLSNRLLPLTRSELAVPLIANNKVVGVLDMQSDKPETFNPANLPAFQVLAAQLAIAIQNATLFSQAEEARLEVEEQARRLTSSGWQEFLNAVDRSESIGYVFNQDEVLPLVETQPAEFHNTLVVPIEITGASVGKVQLADNEDRQWTDTETEIVQATVSYVAQHIENLRLLAQAEGYRNEAEQVSRRLTSEGWNEYLRTRKELAGGYLYDQSQVQPWNGNTELASAISHPLIVRDETIGELIVGTENGNEAHASEVVEAVVQQLSDHIESLRLLEQAEQRRAELQQGEARLRTLVENAPEAIIVVDLATGLFAEPNENATKLYGLPREELVKVGPAQMSPPNQPDGRDSTEKAMEKIGEAMQGGVPVFEWIHRNAQGQDFPCEVRLVRLPSQRPQVRATVTDITERKRNQEILAQRADQLETVATLSSTASTVLDPDKLLQAVVDLSKERFGLYHAHIYLADNSWQTLLLASGAGEVGRKMVAEEHSIPIDTEKSLVARAVRERQSVIANDVRSQPDFLPNPLLPDTRAEMAVPMIVGDNVLGVFDVQSDTLNGFSKEDAAIYTTLASQVAIALQNARLYVEQAATLTQLRELDRLKSSFLANMSHELRTPLNSILGFTDVMLEGLDGQLTDYMDNDLRLIQKNGQHLLHLINDVLDMAKIESGRMNLHPEKFKVHSVLDEVTSITSTLASEKNLSLFIEESSDQEIEIYADNTRLRQVMINLVNNSIKFTEKGKISICVKPMDGARLSISVKDTGIGIPSDKLDAVFQEFTQVDTSTTRKAGGTGLGLPISRRLVEMHGGRLWAESTGVEGEGSTFHVELPLEARITEVIEKQEK
jgi:PAS domain S-box-containing protein